MMTHHTPHRIIARSMDQMRKKEHLPQDLARLFTLTANLLAEENEAMDIDLSGIDLASVPLCPPERFPLDFAHFNTMAGRVLDLILDAAGELPPAMSNAAQMIKEAVGSRSLDLGEAFRELAAGPGTEAPAGRSKILTSWAARTPDAPAALSFVVKVAATPCLEAGAAALAEAAGLSPEDIHSRGACPVCGSRPYILELRGKEGQRFAHCPFCCYTYRIRRLACACCDNDNLKTLKYFTADGETGFRTETCDTCGTYVKTIDFRNLDRQVFAPLNDLESLVMDILARDRGFHRMAPSVWAI